MNTESAIVESIQRKLAALDAEFDSAANRRTGKLNVDQYTKRHAELVKRLREQENAPPAPKAAPALSEARLNELLSPPKIPALAADDVRELAAFNRNFNEAINSGDIAAARTIQKDPRRESLAQNAQLARASETLRSGYATTGARSLLPMLTGVIAVLTHELNETRMSAKIDRASRVDAFDDFNVSLDGRTFEFSMRCGDRLVKRAVKAPIPFYVGVWRDGMKAQQADVVSMGGSLWIAKRDTSARPPADDWQCCVQKGRDAR